MCTIQFLTRKSPSGNGGALFIAARYTSGMLSPTFAASSLATLDVERLLAELRQRGIGGISFDVDDTLTGHFTEQVAPQEMAVLRRLVAAGLPIGINSNAGQEARVARVASIVAHLQHELSAGQIHYVTSAQTGRRKPHPVSYEVLAEKMGLAPRELLHVGDQLMRDVLGARRAGYGAELLLVQPLGGHGNWFVQHAQRPLERLLIRLLGHRVEWLDAQQGAKPAPAVPPASDQTA